MPTSILGFIDLETTGHDPLGFVDSPAGKVLTFWHEIIDIGCVFVRSDTLENVGELEALVIPQHPERCIPNIINHFPERKARGEWKDALSLNEAILGLLSACHQYGEGNPIVPGGQNWFFDWSFLVVAFALTQVEEKEWSKYLHYKRFDTASMAVILLRQPGEGLDMSLFSLRSGKLQKALGIKPEPVPHRAINGARQALEVFRKLEELKRGGSSR